MHVVACIEPRSNDPKYLGGNNTKLSRTRKDLPDENLVIKSLKSKTDQRGLKA